MDERKAEGWFASLFRGKAKTIRADAEVDKPAFWRSWLAARAPVDADAKRRPIKLPLAANSFRSAFMPVMYAGLISMIQPLVGAIGGAVGGLAAMAANLLTVVKLAAAAPAALGGLFGLISTMKIVTGALAGDVEKLPQDLQQVRREFDLIGASWKEITAGAARSFWRDMREDIRPTAEVMLPLLREGIEGNTKAVSDGLKPMLAWARTPLFSDQFRKLTGDSTKMLSAGMGAILGWTQGLLNMSSAAGPLVDRITGWITKSGQWASQLAAPGERADAFGKRLEYAATKAEQLGRMARDAWKAITNTFAAGRDSGDSLLSSLEANIKRWRDWTESASGQNRIKQWFLDIEPIAREVGDLIIDVGKSLARMSDDPNIGNMAKTIRQDLLPVLEDFLTNMGQSIGPAVVDLLKETFRALKQMSDNGSPIAFGLQTITGAIRLLGDFMEAHPNLARHLGALAGALVAYRAMSFVINASGLFTLIDKLGIGLTGGRLTSSVAGFGLAAVALSGQLSGVDGPATAAATALGLFLTIRPFLDDIARGFAGFSSAWGNFRQNLRDSSGISGAATAIGTSANAGLRGAWSGLLAAVGGPGGLALAGAVTAVGLWAQAHQDAKARTEAYKAHVEAIAGSLDKETGALTEATRAKVVDKLETDGLLVKAGQHGVALNLVTDAAMGNADAMSRIRSSLQQQQVGYIQSADKAGVFRQALEKSGITVEQYAAAAVNSEAGQMGMNNRIREAATSIGIQGGALDILLDKFDDSAASARGFSDEMRTNARAIEQGISVDARKRAALDATESSVRGVISAINAVPGSKETTVKALTESAIGRLQQLGFTVQRLPDGQFRVTANTAAAEAQLNYAARNRTSTVTQYVRTIGGRIGGANAGLYADGAILRFAEGGIRAASKKVMSFARGTEKHIAQIAKPGEWRIWAEPETDGEAYIPLARSKRSRSMDILQRVADEFGVAVTPKNRFASIGVTDRSQPAPTRGGGLTGDSGGRSIVMHEGAVKVYNPAPEPASKSVSDVMRSTAEFGLFEGDD